MKSSLIFPTNLFPHFLWKQDDGSLLLFCGKMRTATENDFNQEKFPVICVAPFEKELPPLHYVPQVMLSDEGMTFFDPSIKEEDLNFSPATHPELKSLHILKEENLLQREQWNELFEKAQRSFKEKRFKKVVLAKAKKVKINRSLLGKEFLPLLKDITLPQKPLFYQETPEQFFVGISPERLFKIEGETLFTTAIAGTRKKEKKENLSLATELLNSAKDLREHQLVTEFITHSLHPFCENLAVEEVNVLELPHLLHLRQRIEGQLKSSTSPLTLMNTLHPTPALGGLPQKEAREFLAKEEPFERGLYGGVMGFYWKGKFDSYVCIRSAFVKSDELFFFSGAGIVPSSNVDKEWEETENKFLSTRNSLLSFLQQEDH